MSRNGRTKGAYAYKFGPRGEGETKRLYSLSEVCTSCGARAANLQTLCHDCLGEAGADFMPTPEQIAAEAALIKQENEARGEHRVAVDFETQPFQLQVCKAPRFNRKAIY